MKENKRNMKTQVSKLGGKWTKTHHENFQVSLWCCSVKTRYK